MQNQLEMKSSSSSQQWISLLEILTAVGAAGGAIAAVVSQQVLVASLATVPLSASVVLNLVNRHRLLGELSARSEVTAGQLSQQQSSLDKQHLSLEQLTAQSKGVELRQDALNSYSLKFNANDANAFYNRALWQQQQGDVAAALRDYTEALQINPCHAKAYHNRGLAQASLGHKKDALEDLRNAAKLFFEMGDITSYQKAKDLSKQLHAFETNAPKASEDKIALDVLFT